MVNRNFKEVRDIKVFNFCFLISQSVYFRGYSGRTWEEGEIRLVSEMCSQVWGLG